MTRRVLWPLGAVCPQGCRSSKASSWGGCRPGQAHGDGEEPGGCCCLGVSKEISILCHGTGERWDLGVGDTGAILGHSERTRGEQELAVLAAWVKGNSPLFQRSTHQGFKEGNQIAAYNFALSMFWILRVCLIKGILCQLSVQNHFVVIRRGRLGGSVGGKPFFWLGASPRYLSKNSPAASNLNQFPRSLPIHIVQCPGFG